MANIDTIDTVDIGNVDAMNSVDIANIESINGLLVPGGVMGTLWTWGSGSLGRLGDGTTAAKSSPVQIGSESTWTCFAFGEAQGHAIREGKLFSWGWGDSGRLGLGSVTTYSSPVQVGTGTDWVYVDAGLEFGMAIKSNGEMWGWGENHVGQLGDLTLVNKSSPIQIGSASNWVNVKCSEDSWVAVNESGELWTCGSGFYGVLGIGSTAHKSSPMQVGALTNWGPTLSCGFRTIFNVKTDGTLWCFGRNDYYQLGFPNSTSHRSSPVQIGTGTDWNWASQAWNNEGTVPSRHGCGIKGGSLQGWGLNHTDGRMGDLFTYTSGLTYSSPVQLGATGTWLDIGIGTKHNIAIKSDGSLWSWGEGNPGQLGRGSISDQSSPMQVGALTDWQQVDAKDLQSGGIRAA